MNSNRIPVFGVEFDSITMEEALDRGVKIIENGEHGYVVTPNPEIVMAAMQDEDYCRTLNGASLVLPDGIGVIYGAKILGTPLRGRVTGVDFASGMFRKLAERGGSVFLFGAKPGVAEKAAARLAEEYSGLVIAGCENGYFSDDSGIIAHINEASPDLLLVCLGFPKQERWMADNVGSLNARLMAGLGGALDVFAGNVKRAPEVFRKLGLEWFYRLITDPSRFKRMIRLPLFLVKAVEYRLRRK